MPRYHTNEDPLEPIQIGIGAWALIPMGLFLIVFILLSQYGLNLFFGKDAENQSEVADRPTAISAQDVSPAQQLKTRQQLKNSIGMVLTLVPAGRLPIKAAPFSDTSSENQSESKYVPIPQPFYLGTYEVTNEQYYAVMQSFQHRYKPGNRPATKISWTNAVEFCRRLSATEAEQKQGRVYRLPTESEWEYACRAGTSTPYSFSGGGVNLPAHAWYASNANGSSHAVGTRQANAWGLFDMHGNVWEWCADRFQFTTFLESNTSLPGTDKLRVRRGGGWLSMAAHCQSDFRRGLESDRTLSDVGFRVVMSRFDSSPNVATINNLATSTNTTSKPLPDIPPEPRVAPVQLASAVTNSPSPAAVPTTDAATPGIPTSRSPASKIPSAGTPLPEPPLPKTPEPGATSPKTLHSRHYLINSIGMTMRRIEPGTWTPSAAELASAGKNNDATGKLRIDRPFYVGIHEVTQEQFQVIMGANPSRFRGPDRPVETVHWHDAQRFCEKLSVWGEEKSAGRKYRLPTEAEWEYCCRAAESNVDEPRRSPAWIDLHLWCANNSGQTEINAVQLFQNTPQHYPDQILSNGCQTHPVGQKRPNRWSLFDMQGNVWEWCADVDSNSPKTNTAVANSPSMASQQVIRGGSWYDVPNLCRPSSRTKLGADDQYDNVGFRVVCEQSSNPSR